MMPNNIDINDDNCYLYCAANYVNPQYPTQEELDNDLSRYSSLNILFRRYNVAGELNERLVLNHLIILHNVFGIKAGNIISFFKIHHRYHPQLKTFLIFLNLIDDHQYKEIPIDINLVRILREI